MMRFFKSSERENGAGLIEYALLIGLIVMVCVGAVAALGGELPGGFEDADSGIAP